MVYTLLLGLFLPLVGFLVLLATSNTIGRQLTNWIACSTIFISFLCFISLLYTYTNIETISLFSWIPVNGINADFTLRIDSLSLLMTLIITGVGFLIHVYSIGYIEHEEDFARYFACMNFFVFAMLLLVLAGNLLLLYTGWEGVGLASYLLIGYWYFRPSAARAATKAFVINRIGDVGLLIGLLLTFQLFGTSDINTILQRAGPETPLLTLITLLYFVGAIGKSAQLPLYTWLPDAMEGPTPVSALIHAATMVTAGVYLVVRMHPLFVLAPTTLYTVGIIGGVTSLFAALCALGQIDLKRVLAYSTISQLGLMFLAAGVGAFYAAMFHLTTHAFIKALLFLSAGNVIHMMRGTTDMEKMGGLSQKFTKTHWFFLIGVLAMSGIPPFAAFFSKDLILEVEHLLGFDTFFYVGLATSILTAFYLTRAYCLTFAGAPRLDSKIFKAIKEAPPVMLIPVATLALLSIVGGFLGFSYGMEPLLERFLFTEVDVTPIEDELDSGLLLLTPGMWIALVGALLGVGSAAILYTRFADRLEPPLTVLRRAFYVDEIYWRFIARPLAAFAKFIAEVIEPKVFSGSINAVTKGTQTVANWLQQLQSGQVRSYVAWMVVGAVFLIVYFSF